jgi:iron complex outermembrane receptor protein
MARLTREFQTPIAIAISKVLGGQSLKSEPAISLLASTVLCFACCSSSQAQSVTSESPSAPASNSASPTLEEIVITAQRRAENLQDVPIAVSAYTPEKVGAFRVQSIEDLQIATPQLIVNDAVAYTDVHIRGVGDNFTNPGLEQAVAIYVDGVPTEDSTGSVFDVVDISSLQVLEGPQGTLYGRNATGGAIIINTANPSNVEEGRIAVEYGKFNHEQIDAVWNEPITDDLKVRFAMRTYQDDGYISDSFLGKELGKDQYWLLRGKISWTPAEDTEFLFSTEFSDKRDGVSAVTQLAEGAPGCVACNSPGASPPNGFYSSTQGTYVPFDEHYSFSTFKFNQRFDGLSLTNLIGYRDSIFDAKADVDGSQLPAFNYHSYSRDKTFSEDLQLASNFSGPLNVIGGIFYSNSSNNFQNTLEGTNFGPLVPVNTELVKTNASSAFAELYYKIIPSLKLTVGGRYNSDRKALTSENDPDGTIAFGTAGFHQAASFHSFTPRYVLDYKTDIGTFYVSRTQGFKSGGLSTPAFNEAPTILPETIVSYEVGAKNSWLENRLRTNFDVFHYHINNLQVQVNVYPQGNVVQNAAGTTGNGAEFGAEFAATKEVTLGAGLSYLDAYYSEYKSATVYVPGPGGGGWAVYNGCAPSNCGADISGSTVENAPRWSGYVNASFDHSFSNGWKTNISAAARYSSSYYFFPNGGGLMDHFATQPSNTLINTTGYISPPGDRLRLGFYVKNLTNVRYYDYREITTDGKIYVAQHPATFGVTFQYKF